VKSCFATFVDVYGIPKSKQTPIDAFEHMCDGSELYTVGAVEGLGLAGPQEDECATVPDLASGIVLPWDKTRAWFSSDLFYHGEPYAGDIYHAHKLREWEQCFYQVSDEQRRKYLTFI
jgi:glutamine synthetase